MNRGAQHLAAQVRAWISEEPDERTQNGAAELVGCDTGNFSKILRGDRLPGRALSVALRLYFGTEPEWFDQPADSADPAA